MGSIVVFWLEDGQPRHESFGEKELSKALQYSESVRKRGAEGKAVSHICISTDFSENVGKPGVSDKLPEGYDWEKRRGDPIDVRPRQKQTKG